MLEVTFAFVVATVLFFCFERTRWMGIVGVFLLLCINPLFVVGLVLLLVLAGFYVFARRKRNALKRYLLGREIDDP